MMLRQGLKKFSYQCLLSSVFLLALVPGVHAEDEQAPLARAIQNIVPSGTVVVYDPAVNIEAMVIAPDGKGEWLAQVQKIADQAHLSVKQEDSILHISNSNQDGAASASPEVVTTPVALSSAQGEEEKWVDQGKTLPQDTAPLSVVDVPETTTAKPTESSTSSGASDIVLASSKNLPQQPEPSSVSATTSDNAPAVSVDSSGVVAINGQPSTSPTAVSSDASVASPVATGMADTLRQAAQIEAGPTDSAPSLQPVTRNEVESAPGKTEQSEGMTNSVVAQTESAPESVYTDAKSAVAPLTTAPEKPTPIKKERVASPVKKPAKPIINSRSDSDQMTDTAGSASAPARLVSGTVMGTPRWTGHQENQGKFRESSTTTLPATAPLSVPNAAPTPAATPSTTPVALTVDDDAFMEVPAPINIKQDRLTETPLPGKDVVPVQKTDKAVSSAIETSIASQKSSSSVTQDVASAPVVRNTTGNSLLAQGTVMGVPQYDVRHETRPADTTYNVVSKGRSVGHKPLAGASSGTSMQVVGMMSLGGAISKLKPAKYHVVYASDVDPSVSVNVPLQGTWQEKLSTIAVAASVRIEDSQGTLTIRRAVAQTGSVPVVPVPAAPSVVAPAPSSIPSAGAGSTMSVAEPAAEKPSIPVDAQHETVIQTTTTVVDDKASSDKVSSSPTSPEAATPEQAARANAQAVSPPMNEPVGSNFDPSQAERPVASRGLWQAERGSSLRDVLQSWCDRAGVQLVWSSQFDFPLQATVSLDDTFEGAVRTLLGGFASASPRPVGQLHRQANFGTRVLIVQTRGNRYGE